MYVGIYITDFPTPKNGLSNPLSGHPAEPKARTSVRIDISLRSMSFSLTKNQRDVLSRGFWASIHLGTAYRILSGFGWRSFGGLGLFVSFVEALVTLTSTRADVNAFGVDVWGGCVGGGC